MITVACLLVVLWRWRAAGADQPAAVMARTKAAAGEAFVGGNMKALVQQGLEIGPKGQEQEQEQEQEKRKAFGMYLRA